MMVGSRDALHALESVLATVGGTNSVFLGRLRDRMAEIRLPIVAAAPLWRQLLPPPLEAEAFFADDNSVVDNIMYDIEDVSDLVA